jgi:predicted flap endonuclease-1-like 5' DNA nuclease
MMDWIQANVVLVGVVAVLALLALVLLLRRGRAVPPPREYRDVLSEGAAPAQRNRALIDAPPAAAITPFPAGGAMAGPMAAMGEEIAFAAQQEVAGAASSEVADDLTRIKGLGPKLAAALRQLGITRYAQIAAWTEADVAAIDAQLGAFAGRATRDNWIEQCRLLAASDTGAFEAKFGKL